MTSEDFKKLYMLDCSAHIEKKDVGGGRTLSYLSWSYAWAHFKSVYPDATYEVVKFDGLPYIADAALGIMVYTRVTVDGLTHEMWLPVMDPANRAMRLESYSYKVWNAYKKAYEDKVVKAADMMDINKTIMRCLTKNLAMFGVGLSIYAGEDIPQPLTELEEGAIEAEYKEHTAQAAKPAEAKTKAPARARKQPKQEEPAKEAEQPAEAKKHLTMDMFVNGQLQPLVDWLESKYDEATSTIPAVALDKVATSYDWEDAAFKAVKDAALKSAFRKDINNS